jgi:hypothetical protein
MSRPRLILLWLWVGLFVASSLGAILGFTERLSHSILTPAAPGRHFFVEHGRIGVRRFSAPVPIDQLSEADKQRVGGRTFTSYAYPTTQGVQMGTPGSSVFYHGHGAAAQWPSGNGWTIDEVSLSYTFVWWMSLPSLIVVAYLFYLARRKRRLITAGLCRYCGYDLRATPDRCPECGRTRAT